MKKDIFLSFLSSLLLILSFPNFNLWISAWFGFVPLFFVLENRPKTEAFLLSFFTGIIFWSGIIYWLIHVTLPGTIILILYLALYFGVFGLAVSRYSLLATRYSALIIPSLWVILEYIRAHLFTGFPWALLGYSQYLNLPIIQIADLTGAWGVSFLVVMVNAAIYSVIGCRLSVIGARLKYLLLPILCLIVTLIYGYYKTYRTPNTEHRIPIKISVIQGNIPQELKWQPEVSRYISDKYSRLTEQASKTAPDLIIWPEASSPGLLGASDAVFKDIFSLAKKIKTPLVIGAVVRDSERYFNSALLVNSFGEIVDRYDKLHLVPFGEYIPLKKVLPFLETIVPIGDITPGREYTIFKIPNPKSQIPNSKITNNFAVLICFEDLFPELSRQFVLKGAQFLVNITNDAWYKKTGAAAQHFQASVFRAVENRVFLVRSANTGVSGFIDPSGRIISKVSDKFARDIFIDGIDTRKITISKKPLTAYTRYGDIFIVVCVLFVLYGIIRTSKRKP
jgi:apolipoprotein N-acyltransferase